MSKNESESEKRVAKFTIRGLSPLCWTRYLSESKRDDEDGRKFEERVWKSKVHVVTVKGKSFVGVPALGLRDSFAEGAKDLKIGKGAARGKNLLKTTTLPLMTYYATDQSPDKLRSEWRMLPSNPGRNSGTRVPKLLPMLDEWEISGEVAVFDDRITEDLLTSAINKGGLTCGIGALRVQGGGVLGRYELVSLKF